jgi:hypothetical protein
MTIGKRPTGVFGCEAASVSRWLQAIKPSIGHIQEELSDGGGLFMTGGCLRKSEHYSPEFKDIARYTEIRYNRQCLHSGFTHVTLQEVLDEYLITQSAA